MNKLVLSLVFCLLWSATPVCGQGIAEQERPLQEVLSMLPNYAVAPPASQVEIPKNSRHITKKFILVGVILATAMAVDTYSTIWSNRCCPSCVETTPGVHAFADKPKVMFTLGFTIDFGIMGTVDLMSRHPNPAIRNSRYALPLAFIGGHAMAAVHNFGLC